jgi:hypothetical protein
MGSKNPRKSFNPYVNNVFNLVGDMHHCIVNRVVLATKDGGHEVHAISTGTVNILRKSSGDNKCV